MWFSFEAEALALPPEWIAHPKDLIPLAETNTAARKREQTEVLKKLEQEKAELEQEKRLCLKKEDFVRVKELMPLIDAVQQKIEEVKKPPAKPKDRKAQLRARVKGKS